jgi:hypothetical protein
MQGLFLVLATAGILYSLREGVATAPLVLLLVIIYFSGHVALDPCPRYQLPAMPYVFMFGAYAVTKMNEYRKTIHG